MQTPPFQVSPGEIQDTQIKPITTTAPSRAVLFHTVSLRTDARIRLAAARAEALLERQTVTTTNSPAANPRNQNSLGNPSDPVNPDVGAVFDPAGPVITATTRTPARQMTKRRSDGLVARVARRAGRGTF